MQNVINIIPYAQVILSVLLVAGVLIQQTDSSLGAAFGGGDSFSSTYHTKRGAEKFIFVSTIVIAVLFTISALISLIFS